MSSAVGLTSLRRFASLQHVVAASLVTLLLHSPLFARSRSDWAVLQQVAASERIRIELADHSRQEGRFMHWEPNQIQMNLASGAQTLGPGQVRRLWTLSNRSDELRDAVIGGAVGAGLAGILVATSTDPEARIALFALPLVGIMAGFRNGHFEHDHAKLVYRAP